MDDVSLPVWLPEKAEYAEAWAHNSASFENQGCYEWMAGELAQLAPKRVLDIGTGLGQGIVAILRAYDCELVSIDENAVCLQEAAQLLQERGFAAETLYRLGYIQHPDGSHDLALDDEPIIRQSKISLVHADLLLPDAQFERFLAEQPKFDSVTLWLMGTFKLRSTCRALRNFEIKSPEEYRLRVENKAHDIAAQVLRPGGWLQIAFRSEIPAEESIRAEVLDSYREQASTTDLEPFALTFREYEESRRRGIRMIWTRGDQVVDGANQRSAMCSVLSRKPLTR